MSEKTIRRNFIQHIIDGHLASGRFPGPIRTRFPPEPNAYLHIGHAKAICLNFSLAAEYGGECNLRFDDTNPTREEDKYVHGMQEDIRWLGYDWEDRLYFASDYFEQLYVWAEELIRKDKAYVDDLSAAEIREYRGTLTEPGRNSPWRDRPQEESLDLFRRMRAGEFPDGARVLRAKIDMSSPNLNLRDPVMYRILHATHHRTGDDWCIYPTYDWAHGQSDAIEGITHSLCSLEFEDHRPLYDWFLDQLEDVPHPQQIEFARLELTHTITSKRKSLILVQEGHVDGWDDPRMPTLRALRRRGYPPAAIRTFCDRIGVAKDNSVVDFGLLEHTVREELNRTALRVMGVLDPLKVVIENWPDGKADEIEAVNNPEDASAGTRKVPFGKELWIERADFMEDPPRRFFRLAPGREVRLRYAYFVRCIDVIRDADGRVTELRCTYDPATRGGNAPDGRKVRGTIHWVSAAHAIEGTVRIYDHLFATPDPSSAPEGSDFRANLDPNSRKVVEGVKLVQFERQGYFCVDAADSSPDRPVFNRTTGLRDTWAKIAKREQKKV
jgi:glutaminyl-tRNA synthetase